MYSQTSCTSSDLDKKHMQSLKKDPDKTVGGVAFTRYPVSKCIKPKIKLLHNQSIIWEIVSKKDPDKPVGGVAWSLDIQPKND